MSIGGHHSPVAAKDEWLTPPNIIQACGPFDLDPCSPVGRPWPTAGRHLTIDDDGLAAPWNGRVWLNPPYGRQTGRWLARAVAHGNCTALVFARTETADWVSHIWNCAHSILFLYGRLHFHHVCGTRAPANSGAPSALISYNEFNTEKLESSGLKGKLINL